MSGAAEIYRQILKQDPSHPRALFALAVISFQTGASEEAEPIVSALTERHPGLSNGWILRANIRESLGRHEASLSDYDTALALDPVSSAAHLGRAKSLVRLERYEEALASCRSVASLDPENAEANRLGASLLLAHGRLEEAETSFRNHLRRHPGDASAHVDLGIVLSRLGRQQEALQSYGLALAGAPNNAGALYNRGNLLIAMERFEEAAADCAKVLTLDPTMDWARGNLLWSKLQCCDWIDLEKLRSKVVADVNAGKRVLNPHQYASVTLSAESQLRCARIWANGEFPAQSPLWRGEIYQHDQIRVGYMSADFGDHATAHLMAGVFERHDRKRFKTYAVSLEPTDGSPMRSRLEAAFDEFIDAVKMNDRQIASLVRELEIDILVDLKGYTLGARVNVLAMRPAPIQVSYLGYPGTTGADYLDYVLADQTVIPKEHFPVYSEQVVWLPDSYQCNDDKRPLPAAGQSRAQLGLPNSGFVYCCFNANYKILPQTFDLWVRIMARLDDSVLWLIEPRGSAIESLRREAKNRGIDPSRLIFAPRANQEEHLSRLRLADLMLDTLPCNAHTTAADALWAGVPVLTLIGSTFAGRVGASLLSAVGMPELIAKTGAGRVQGDCIAPRERSSRAGRAKRKTGPKPRNPSAFRYRGNHPSSRNGLCNDVDLLSREQAA